MGALKPTKFCRSCKFHLNRERFANPKGYWCVECLELIKNRLKKCKKCQQIKSFDRFWKRRENANDEERDYVCIDCDNIRHNRQRQVRRKTDDNYRRRIDAQAKIQRSKPERLIKSKQRLQRPEVAQKLRARNKVAQLVRTNMKLPAVKCECAYCGRIANQYHHHNGYADEHALDVIPLCGDCHLQEDYRIRSGRVDCL